MEAGGNEIVNTMPAQHSSALGHFLNTMTSSVAFSRGQALAFACVRHCSRVFGAYVLTVGDVFGPNFCPKTPPRMTRVHQHLPLRTLSRISLIFFFSSIGNSTIYLEHPIPVRPRQSRHLKPCLADLLAVRATYPTIPMTQNGQQCLKAARLNGRSDEPLALGPSFRT